MRRTEDSFVASLTSAFLDVRQRHGGLKEHPAIPVTDGLLKVQHTVKSLARSAGGERGP